MGSKNEILYINCDIRQSLLPPEFWCGSSLVGLGHSLDLAWEDRLGLSRQTRFLSQNYEGQIMTYSLKSLTIQTHTEVSGDRFKENEGI